MEYYNTINETYTNALQSQHLHYKFKIELLDHWEMSLGEIVRDMSISSAGQLNINYQQGTRRSCTLSILDIDNNYIPNEDSLFWYNRKFKLYIGLVVNDDIYWFSQGVFLTQNADYEEETRILNIDAIDKFGIFDGTLGTGRLETNYKYPVGTNIASVIKDTLVLDLGNGLPYDPIKPHMYIGFNTTLTQAEIEISENTYIGEFFTTLAESYVADVFYDENGYFNFSLIYDENITAKYEFMAHQWDFTKNFYCDCNTNYNFDSLNTVTVYTNADDTAKTTTNDNGETDSTPIVNVSYTAYNNNAQSQARISSIGIRRAESIEIPYVEKTVETMTDRCRQVAENALVKNNIMTMTKNFTSVIIPHLDVNRTIGVPDKNGTFETYIVQSITISLDGSQMSISATNIKHLKGVTV